jgi:MFS family permease
VTYAPDSSAPQPGVGAWRSPLAGLVGACFVSGLGTAMSVVAIPWLVLVMTDSAAATGIVGFAQMAPYVALQATAGPLVERLGLRRAFLLGNTLAAFAMVAVPVLHAAGELNLGVLAALVAVAGAVRGLADAATTPLIPAVAEASRVPIERATGTHSAANRTALLVGMPLAGVLIAATGAASVVLVDGISFAAAAATLALSVPTFVTQTGLPSGPLRLRSYVAELAEGMRFLRADRLLLGIVAMVANPILGAVQFERIPVRLHARVLGAIKASAWLGIPFGSLLGGVLTQQLGLSVALLTCGSVMLVVTLAPFIFPVWRGLERPAHLGADANFAAAVEKAVQ